jgi:predicted dehydrogenase
MSEKCLIIGLGQIGMAYDLNIDTSKAVYSHARAFSLHHAFKLCGGGDPSATQRAIFEGHYGQPAYTDIESAMTSEMPSVVVIALPTKLHGAAINTVLLHSTPKVILCEKPLAYDLVEARKMVEACENAGVKLFVNYMRRADIGAIEVKKRIEEGDIALPIKGVAWYSKGFLHNGSHFFNLLEFWLGSFVNAKVLDSVRLWENQDPELDVQVEFERGKVVFQAAWEEAFSHSSIELLSPSGRLRYEQSGELIAWQSTQLDPNFSGYKILQNVPEIIETGMSRYQYHVACQVADALANKPHSLCTGQQALATLEAMHQIINLR